jgi:hypothetical protein
VPQDVRTEAIKLVKVIPFTKKDALRPIEAAGPEPAEDTDMDAVGAMEDTNTDVIDTTDDVLPDRSPIPEDNDWQETVRDWIDGRRGEPILLREVINRFAETIPAYLAARRWHFDFEERVHLFQMRRYALMVSLRSLGVQFSPPLGRDLYPAPPETELTVQPRRRRWW